MRILFWNLQCGNPMEMGMDGKGGQIQTVLAGLQCDVLICCEVQDAAIDDAEIETIKEAAALELVCLEEHQPEPYSGMTAARRLKLVSAKKHVGFESSTLRSGMKFRRNNRTIRANKKMMAEISAACGSMDDPLVLARKIFAMKHPKVAARMKRAPIAPLITRYPKWTALDAKQQHRNYLIFTTLNFKMTQVDVQVASAKRKIVRLDFGSYVIFAVHSPAFGKGGGETALQLASLINAEKQPCIAIGDMNIDLEELNTEVGENPHDARFALFNNGSMGCFGPAPHGLAVPFRRRWHPARGTIQKVRPRTQKSGGTLDFVIAPSAANVTVSIAVPVESFSDHAAIVAEWV